MLPLPLDGELDLPRAGAPIAVGYRGGFFHPVTGYSLPLAARVALAVAKARTPEETLTRGAAPSPASSNRSAGSGSS